MKILLIAILMLLNFGIGYIVGNHRKEFFKFGKWSISIFKSRLFDDRYYMFAKSAARDINLVLFENGDLDTITVEKCNHEVR